MGFSASKEKRHLFTLIMFLLVWNLSLLGEENLSEQNVSESAGKNPEITSETMTDNPASQDNVNRAQDPAATSAETEVLDNSSEKKVTESTAAKSVNVKQVENPRKKVEEQFRWTPVDPSFLYETRFIPGHKEKEEFLPEEMEKEVIVERIEEEKNFRKSLAKIEIDLPNPGQLALVIGIITLIVVYRMRVNNSQKRKR